MSGAELCPKCSFPRPVEAVECPACGIVYTKAQRRRPPPLPATPPPPTATDPSRPDFNPYAPPQASLRHDAVATADGPAIDVWQQGDWLVMRKGAVLPSRCVRCNRPAAEVLMRPLSWHPPWIYLFVLGGLLVYVVLALVMRKTARIDVPLCADHSSRRRRSIGLSLFALVAGVALGILSFQGEPVAVGCLMSTLLALGGLVALLLVVNPVVPKKIDDHCVWLRNVCFDYRAQLRPPPDWVPWP